MAESSPKRNLLLLLAAFLLSTFFVVETSRFIRANSNTYDEVAYIGAGIDYVKTGRLLMDIREHPPLMKYLIGLSVNSRHPSFEADPTPEKLDESYAFGYRFLFKNSLSPETILLWARLPTLFLSLLSALFIFSWSQRWFGLPAAVVSLALYATEPNILAHSGLATFDIPVTTFMLGTMFFFTLWIEQKKPSQLLLAGVFLGFGLSTKLPAGLATGWVMATAWIFKEKIGLSPKKIATAFGIFGLVAAIVLVLCYRVIHLPAFVEMLTYRASQIFSGQQAFHNNFIHGDLVFGRRWSYYVLAFFIKTSIPFVALFLFSLFRNLRDKKTWVLLIPFCSQFLICSASNHQMGFRYLLPAFPYIIIFMGGAFASTKKPFKFIFIALIGWALAEATRISPHSLSYFNQLVGGPSKGYQWLGDANLDWGQDLPAIKKYTERNADAEIIMASTALADLNSYIPTRQDFFVHPLAQPDSYRHINSLHPKKEYLIVNSSFMQGSLSDPRRTEWLWGLTAIDHIAHGILVFDITNDAPTQARLGKNYLIRGRYPFAFRQFQRAQRIDPLHPAPYLGMADTQALIGNPSEAKKLYRQALSHAQTYPDIELVIKNRLADIQAGKTPRIN